VLGEQVIALSLYVSLKTVNVALQQEGSPLYLHDSLRRVTPLLEYCINSLQQEAWE